MRYLVCALVVLGVFFVAGPALAGHPSGRTAGGESTASGSVPGSTREADTGDAGSPLQEDPALECDSTATLEDLIASAREMFVAGNHTLAGILYQCVLARDPNNVSAILELSVVYEAAGKLQHATGLVSRAAVIRPFDQEIIDRKRELATRLAESLETEANALIARGAHEEALPKLSALLRERPDDPELHYKKALCYYKLGDAVGALVEIDRAAGIRNDIRYSVLRSKVTELGRTQDVGALVREAEALSASGRADDRERVLALLSQILARDPEHPWARREFMLLSNGELPCTPAAAAADSTGRFPLGAYARSTAKQAGAFFTAVARTAERQIPLLVVALVALVLFASPLTSMIVRGFEPRQRLSGRLADFNLQEILSLIHAQGTSGVLRIRAGRMKARVYFVEGEIHHCVSGKAKGRDAVRNLLAQAKGGYFVLTDMPRSFKRTMDIPFSLVLMDIGDRSFLAANAADAQPASPPKKSRMKSLLEDKK